MKKAISAGLVVLGFCGSGHAADPPSSQAWGAAGLAGGSLEAAHFGGGIDYALKPYLRVGAEAAYSYLPLAAQARGGGNRAYWGLVTLSAAARPSARVSPYVVLAAGLGVHESASQGADWGRATALGAGIRVRLGGRASVFLESRLALLGGITAGDGLHAELPVRVGLRLGL